MSVTIRLQDVNDNYPVFEKKQYRRVIEEEATEFRPTFFIKVILWRLNSCQGPVC